MLKHNNYNLADKRMKNLQLFTLVLQFEIKFVPIQTHGVFAPFHCNKAQI